MPIVLHTFLYQDSIAVVHRQGLWEKTQVRKRSVQNSAACDLGLMIQLYIITEKQGRGMTGTWKTSLVFFQLLRDFEC